MQSRIRSIKPEFFTDDRLFDAEQVTGLPLRLAFAGLWCWADREGRFEWRPRQLGVGILPYDGVDFAAALNALAARGFVGRYEVDGKTYGYIPSWHKHQRVRGDEAKSRLPEPPAPVTDSARARDEVVTDPSRGRHVDATNPTGLHVTNPSRGTGTGTGKEGSLDPSSMRYLGSGSGESKDQGSCNVERAGNDHPMAEAGAGFTRGEVTS